MGFRVHRFHSPHWDYLIHLHMNSHPPAICLHQHTSHLMLCARRPHVLFSPSQTAQQRPGTRRGLRQLMWHISETQRGWPAASHEHVVQSSSSHCSLTLWCLPDGDRHPSEGTPGHGGHQRSRHRTDGAHQWTNGQNVRLIKSHQDQAIRTVKGTQKCVLYQV